MNDGVIMSPLPGVQIGGDEPLYNIGVVARMTSVSMATLRAWERRYGFPESNRTSGGHRLYTEMDVMRLRWVKARIDEGMQTAQAIHALRHQEQNGHLVPLENAPVAGNGLHALETRPHLVSFQQRLTDKLVGCDLQGADNILGEALALSSPDDMILDVIGPTLSEIGQAWENGQISVATEHLATNYLRQRLLMWMLSGPPAKSVSPIALACAPNEWHEGSLLILGAILRRRRWPIAYLGQALPLPDLATYVREIRPAMVVLIGMTESTATEMLEWPNYMPEAAQKGRPIIGYGGRVFVLHPEWRLRMAGAYLGNTFREGVATIEKLLQQ
jgi:DNA-binding transcriptional MerR regulator